MNNLKAFFYSFIFSAITLMIIFGCVDAALNTRTSETDTLQQGVPMGMAGGEDSKTILLCVDEKYPYFFLFKFSAIENRVGIAALSPSLEISDKNLAEIFSKAGGMQCLMDIEEQYGINIDYYLQCSWQQLGKIAGDMKPIEILSFGENLPDSIKNYLLKGVDMLDGKSLINAAEKAMGFLDNEIGLAFLTLSRHYLIENNIDILSDCGSIVLKENYSGIVTNINTNRLNRMDRILTFLAESFVEYRSVVVYGEDTDSHEKIASIIQ